MKEREPENKSKFDVSGLRAGMMLSTAGLTLALSVGIGVGIGIFLDKWLKTNYFVIIFTLVGVVAGFRELIRTVIRANEEQERVDAEERQSRRPAVAKAPETGVEVEVEGSE